MRIAMFSISWTLYEYKTPQAIAETRNAKMFDIYGKGKYRINMLQWLREQGLLGHLAPMYSLFLEKTYNQEDHHNICLWKYTFRYLERIPINHR